MMCAKKTSTWGTLDYWQPKRKTRHQVVGYNREEYDGSQEQET